MVPGTYYFSLFPYSTDDLVNENEQNRIQVEVSGVSYRTMTAIIDLTNSDPETCVSYADDAVGMEKGSTDWDDFLGYYPVLLGRDGNEIGKLNPNNYTQFEDGSEAPTFVSSTDPCDVMVAFPKRGVKIETVDNELRISMTDNPDNEEFKYYAHSYGEHNNCDKIYISAYQPYYTNSGVYDHMLFSMKNPLSSGSTNINDFRTYANKKGDGYEQMTFYVRTFLCCAYILRNGNLNSQAVNGVGIAYNASSSYRSAGKTDESGMNYVPQGTYQRVKALGIEDLWGNLSEFVDGIYISPAGEIMTAPYNKNMEYDGNSYVGTGIYISGEIAGFMSKPIGTTETGFIAKEKSGTASTHFCDYIALKKSTNTTKYVPNSQVVGTNKDYAGMFSLQINLAVNSIGQHIGARIVKFNVQE